MLTRADRKSFGLCVLILCASNASQAQSAAARCVTSIPEFATSAPANLRAQLSHMAWPSASYDSLHTRLGVVATFDTLLERSRRLTALAILPNDALGQSMVQSLTTILLRARGELTSAVTPNGLASGKLTAAGLLKPEPDLFSPGSVKIGDELTLQFADDRVIASTALCAVASSASRFLLHLMSDSLNAQAARYASIAKRWTLFEESTYSLSLVERLAASCRLPYLDWLISPTSRCWQRRTRRWTVDELEPPRWRTVFVHPEGGLRPILKADSSMQAASIIEWYGFLRHSYGAKRVLTIGATFATTHFEAGPSRIGGVLHVPYGKVGVFQGSAKSVLITVSADILGWVPGVRAATDQLRIQSLSRAAGKLNELGRP